MRLCHLTVHCDIVTHLKDKLSFLNHNLKWHHYTCFFFFSSDEFIQLERSKQISWIIEVPLNVFVLAFIFYLFYFIWLFLPDPCPWQLETEMILVQLSSSFVTVCACWCMKSQLIALIVISVALLFTAKISKHINI